MKALVRKEAVELLWPVGLLFLATCCAWLGIERFENVLVAPTPQRCLVVVGIAVGAGALIGFVQFAAERWRGTLGFAVHRSGGHASLFAAKGVVGVAATLLLAVGPLFVFALSYTLFSVNASVIQVERLVEYAIYGLSGISGYALGVFVSQLRRGWWLDLSLFVLGTSSVVAVTVLTLWSASEKLASAVFVYLLVQGVMAASLSILALTLMRNARDRDLQPPSGQLAMLTGIGLLFYLAPLVFLVGGLAQLLQIQLLGGYPAIAQDRESGEFSVVDSRSPDLSYNLSLSYVPDGAHERVQPAPRLQLVYSPPLGLRGPQEIEPVDSQSRYEPRKSALVPRWESLWNTGIYETYESNDRRYAPFGFLDREAGAVRIFCTEHRDPEWVRPTRVETPPTTFPMQFKFVKTNERGPFSPSTISMSLENHACCLVDLEDHTMWKVDPFNFATLFGELHLPDGERLVRVEPFYAERLLKVGSFSRYGEMILFVGDKRSYVWNKGQFEPYAGRIMPEAAQKTFGGDPISSIEAEGVMALRVRQTSFDPISPRIEVLDPRTEQILFAHEYAPLTGMAKLETAALCAAAVLRTPFTCLRSFVRDDDQTPETDLPTGRSRSQGEPLLLNGRRPWLLALNFAIAASCAFSLAKRMKRQGASKIVIAVWVALVGVFGVVAYVYFSGLMPKRASVATPAPQTSEAKSLLIQSA